MKEIILLGGGPSWIDCPFDCEVWAANTVIVLHPEIGDKISKIFIFDPLAYCVTRDAVRIAKEKKITIVSAKNYADEKYPYQDIVNEFHSNYFRNTPSYMIAYAIYKGYEKLRLYGIDQGPDWEYICGKPYVMFWLGVATGRGLRYEVSRNCILHEVQVRYIKQRKEELEKEKNFRDITRHAYEPVYIEHMDVEKVLVGIQKEAINASKK